MQKEMGEGCHGDGSQHPTNKGRYDHVYVTDSFPRPERRTGIFAERERLFTRNGVLEERGRSEFIPRTPTFLLVF